MPRYRTRHPDLDGAGYIDIGGGPDEAIEEASRWIARALGRPVDEVASEVTVSEVRLY